MMKAAVDVWPGSMLPKSAVKVGAAAWPLTVVPIDVEADQESLRILDDLRLGGGDAEVVGGTVADVGHLHAEREGYRRLHDGRGQGVLALDLLLPEVVEHQVGAGLDRDLGGEQRARR